MNAIFKGGIAALIPLVVFTAASISNKPANVSITSFQKDSTYSATGLFDANERPVLISKQFSFTEGPAADNKGNIYFTDQPNNAIWKYGTDGKLTLFSNNTGRSNGMYFDKKGNLLTCADKENQLWRFSADGKKSEVILNDLNGHKFNGPNDLWVDAKGGIYFTDPYYQRDYWTHKQSELDGEKVYYLAKGKTQAIVVCDKLQKPNGIAGTIDGKLLYVADIKANKTYKFNIEQDASLSNQHLFTEKGSDGITLDEKGNVYLTGGNGITIYDPEGEKIGVVAIPEPWTANVCFGGKDKNLLFITASKAVYIMQMKVKGSTKNASKQR
ncbi:SMP-30/gluconolactonase/LRE family protein [Mucilaginibacter terrae]|uniref:Gluconolactonase n=1 Tax=Mucilaginibacter terrae TaxID=1955052 RepID=A0ABU3GNY4_9SPHI|nr:SMP-30/gluconolactonase/LRE family protein [Mucilaginibacter terrae]MDT3401509.1 gluconolactonase [Mucilaginibacter terrae]